MFILRGEYVEDNAMISSQFHDQFSTAIRYTFIVPSSTNRRYESINKENP
jgi:hypothetical protein